MRDGGVKGAAAALQLSALYYFECEYFYSLSLAALRLCDFSEKRREASCRLEKIHRVWYPHTLCIRILTNWAAAASITNDIIIPYIWYTRRDEWLARKIREAWKKYHIISAFSGEDAYNNAQRGEESRHMGNAVRAFIYFCARELSSRFFFSLSLHPRID